MAMDGRQRVWVLNLQPSIDGGRFPIKRVAGETVSVEADIVADGHDVVAGQLRWRGPQLGPWQAVPMEPMGNDRYRGQFSVSELGRYEYMIEGWVDTFRTWRLRFDKKVELNQDVPREVLAGSQVLERVIEGYSNRRGLGRALAEDVKSLAGVRDRLTSEPVSSGLIALIQSEALQNLLDRVPAPRHPGKSKIYRVRVDRPRALAGAWYEFFPRSCAGREQGSLQSCGEFLKYVAALGFDVVYLPPIHPIGNQARKGVNNRTHAEPGDPGSPWAIGGVAGGHQSIHPDLGTLEDFDRFHSEVRSLGMELAMDVTFQCSPDHPWVIEHPEWFNHFPDGSIQYAENPPKRYEDVFPLNFDTEDWESLWMALWGVIAFWGERGVRIFRVDNPHTKPLVFWEWLIERTQSAYPDAIFLSEAFTRPALMYALSKAGFSQSYTYFAWRNSAAELKEYFEELTRSEVREYFRPNLWPNTPDILPEPLQSGQPSAFAIRAILAATLGASYGIYGPAFELLEHVPIAPGAEEYDHSEKYEVRQWDLEKTPNIQGLLRKLNHVRHQEPALQNNSSLVFHGCDNPQVLIYSKRGASASDAALLMVVNLDATFTQAGWTNLNLGALHLQDASDYIVHDLLTDAKYHWSGAYNYVELYPDRFNAHILRIETEEGI